MELPIAAVFPDGATAEQAVRELRASGLAADNVRTETLPQPLFNALVPYGVSQAEAAALERRIQGGDVLVRIDGAADPAAVETCLESAGGLLIRAARSR